MAREEQGAEEKGTGVVGGSERLTSAKESTWSRKGKIRIKFSEAAQF